MSDQQHQSTDPPAGTAAEDFAAFIAAVRAPDPAGTADPPVVDGRPHGDAGQGARGEAPHSSPAQDFAEFVRRAQTGR